MRVAVIGHTYVVDANRGKWRALAPRCEAIRLFVPKTWPERDFWVRENEAADDLDIFPLSAVDAGRARRWHVRLATLRREFAAFRPDIVHVEAESGSIIAMACVFARAGWRTTQFVWENIPIDSSWRRRLAKWNLSAVDYLFCGSTGAFETARCDGYSGDASVVAQVGVDLAAADRAPAFRPAGDDRFVIGFVGRMDAKKGVHVLAESFRILDDDASELVFLGDGPDREALRSHVAASPFASQVRFVDPVPHADVAAHIKGFDVLVLPSISTPGWKEQFGHVLIEAMACKVPVIGTRCGAIPEVIGDAGIVVDEGDATALAGAIARLINDAGERNRLLRAGRERVESRYTDAAIADTMHGAWSDLHNGPIRGA
ncbi:MAG: glycosyltransferase [Deltaproteobacteria bacterium]|nr:glycosyltransferase [Deltaproteobacteria bacterium]